MNRETESDFLCDEKYVEKRNFKSTFDNWWSRRRRSLIFEANGFSNFFVFRATLPPLGISINNCLTFATLFFGGGGAVTVRLWTKGILLKCRQWNMTQMFLNIGQPRPLFYFWSFQTHKFYRKNCRRHRDLNSDRQSRRRACWPPDHDPIWLKCSITALLFNLADYVLFELVAFVKVHLRILLKFLPLRRLFSTQKGFESITLQHSIHWARFCK